MAQREHRAVLHGSGGMLRRSGDVALCTAEKLRLGPFSWFIRNRRVGVGVERRPVGQTCGSRPEGTDVQHSFNGHLEAEELKYLVAYQLVYRDVSDY